MSTKTLIPKDFYRCAHSELLNGTGTMYFNKERGVLLLVVDDKIIGQFPADRLECVIHVIKDIYDMKGRYGQV